VYHASLISYVRGAGLDFQPEDHGSFGRSDLVIKLVPQTKVLVNWVIEIKVCRQGEVDETKAQAAFDPIVVKKYDDSYNDSVILGIDIND
jgi:hypothetical protein